MDRRSHHHGERVLHRSKNATRPSELTNGG
nr:MAG TPA: hypothetical protein [Caudoviricetes sp.]